MSRHKLRVSGAYGPNTYLASWSRPPVWHPGTPTGAVTAHTAAPQQQNPLAAGDHSIGDTFIGDWLRVSVGDVIVPDTGTQPEDPDLPIGNLRRPRDEH